MAEILIADDEPAMLKSLSLILEQRGLGIATASTGREVLQQLCRKTAAGEQFDAIILDIKMPDIDGWQVMQAMQANPLWHKIPVVVMSGYANGAVDYANVTRLGGVMVEKKEDFTHVLGAVLDRILAAAQHRPIRVTEPAGS